MYGWIANKVLSHPTQHLCVGMHLRLSVSRRSELFHHRLGRWTRRKGGLATSSSSSCRSSSRGGKVVVVVGGGGIPAAP